MSAIRPLTDLERLAFGLADRAHAGQVRKHTGEPYVNHPVRVADMVRLAGCSDEAVCAAYLHDVVEDTTTGLDEIESQFGSRVTSMVWQLTVLKIAGENRAIRNKRKAECLAKSEPEVATIKLADMLDNVDDIVKHEPGFATLFLEEKRVLLDNLKHGNQALWLLAKEKLEQYTRT